MNKSIDLKNRVVDVYSCDTGDDEDEIVGYLNRKMVVRFHNVAFNNSKYVFQGNPKDSAPGTIGVSSFRPKKPGERVSVDISTAY